MHGVPQIYDMLLVQAVKDAGNGVVLVIQLFARCYLVVDGLGGSGHSHEGPETGVLLCADCGMVAEQLLLSFPCWQDPIRASFWGGFWTCLCLQARMAARMIRS